MLSDKDAVATVAVKNLEIAKKFYEGTLGLTKVMENDECSLSRPESQRFSSTVHSTPGPTRRRP